MKYLCLAYGHEKGWNALDPEEQEVLLAQDELLRRKGMVVAAVHAQVATVQAWVGAPQVSVGSASGRPLPLAGFYIVEAADLAEATQLAATRPEAVPVQIEIPLKDVTRGEYVCQINVVDEVGRKFAFPRAPIIVR